MDIQIMISLIGLFAVGIKLGFDIGRKNNRPSSKVGGYLTQD